MGRAHSYLLVAIGALLLVSTVNAQHGTGENTDGEEQQDHSENHQSSQKSGGNNE